MQTNLRADIRDTPRGRDADRVLRTCVHCGFCNATCPTYQLLGTELDGPRGRIYLIKQVLEGRAPSAATQLHLDRCLTCRACETTCPSGVEYARLLEIGRAEVERLVPRTVRQRLLRAALLHTVPYRQRFAPLLRIGQLLRPLLGKRLRRAIPARVKPRPAYSRRHGRQVIVPAGCVQPALAPQIDEAAVRLLDGLGIEAIRPVGDGCCGAVNLHLADEARALRFMRRNIDAWWPHIQAGAEAIIATATGCGVTVREYAHLLGDDPQYSAKAERVSALARDLSEVLEAHRGKLAPRADVPRRIAFHAPCTLQHGMRLGGRTEALLGALGFELTPVPDAHLCCGSAGTYSILQPELSRALSDDKVRALESGVPSLIATANIGCLLELQRRASVPVIHWIELLAPANDRPFPDARP